MIAEPNVAEARSTEGADLPAQSEEVEAGDAGVAYVKGGYLLDFKPVRPPGA